MLLEGEYSVSSIKLARNGGISRNNRIVVVTIIKIIASFTASTFTCKIRVANEMSSLPIFMRPRSDLGNANVGAWVRISDGRHFSFTLGVQSTACRDARRGGGCNGQKEMANSAILMKFGSSAASFIFRYHGMRRIVGIACAYSFGRRAQRLASQAGASALLQSRARASCMRPRRPPICLRVKDNQSPRRSAACHQWRHHHHGQSARSRVARVVIRRGVS